MARASSVNSTWVGELASNVSIGGSSLTLTTVSGTNWPSGSGIFGVQVGDDPDDDAELCQVTRTTTTLTLSASTLTKAHTAGASIYYLTTAEDINAKAGTDASNTFGGATDTFNSAVALNAPSTAADLTVAKLRQDAQILSTDWMTTFYGFNNTFTSINNRTSGQTTMSVDTDPIDTGLVTSATTYAVNTTTGEVVAITGSFGSGNLGIARGQLTGIGAAAAAAITAGDTWYILPYGLYSVKMEELIDNGFNFDVLQFLGYYTWMPMEIEMPDIVTYETQGREFNLQVDPDEFGGAPITVTYAAGAFDSPYTISSGLKSMFIAAGANGADYAHIGVY